MIRLSSIFSSRAHGFPIDPLLALVLAGVTAGEVGLRVETGAPALVEEGYFPPPHVFDPRVGYRYRPNFRSRFVRSDYANVMLTNADGFHAHTFERRGQPGTYRLALIGDSMLAANQVPVDSAWGERLALALGRVRGRPIEVLSFGVDGYRAWNMAQLLDDTVLAFHPDAVVLWGEEAALRNPSELYRTVARGCILACYDPDKLLAAAERESDQAWSLGSFLMLHSVLSRTLVTAAGKRSIAVPSYRMVEGRSPRLHPLEDLLAGMQGSCRRAGAGFAVFYRNRRPDAGSDSAAALGIPTTTDADLFPTYAGLTFPSDPHFDVAGNARYAQAVAPLFRALLEGDSAAATTAAKGLKAY